MQPEMLDQSDDEITKTVHGTPGVSAASVAPRAMVNELPRAMAALKVCQGTDDAFCRFGQLPQSSMARVDARSPWVWDR